MTENDWLYIVEFARIATACVPDEIMDQLDITDAEYLRIRSLIEHTLEGEPT
jgi:hypothetical protein